MRLAVYSAGTDVYTHDQLGGLKFSAEGILRRDQYALDLLIERRLPTCVFPSGGYSRESCRLFTDLAIYAIDRWSPAAD